MKKNFKKSMVKPVVIAMASLMVAAAGLTACGGSGAGDTTAAVETTAPETEAETKPETEAETESDEQTKAPVTEKKDGEPEAEALQESGPGQGEAKGAQKPEDAELKEVPADGKPAKPEAADKLPEGKDAKTAVEPEEELTEAAQ